MSVLNRKMFKPRNARNALNRSAGIPSVARFHAGGPVGHAHPHPPPGSVFNVATQQIRQPRPETVVSRSGRRFMFPTTSPTLSGATDIGMARTALKGGLGSLNPAEQAYMSAAMGKLAGRNVAAPVKNYLGDSVAGEIVEGASELGGSLSGGVGGLLTGLLSDDTGDKTTLAGRVGLMEPSDEYLASLGIKPADPNPANLQTASAMGRPFPAGPPKPSMTSPGMFQGPRQAVSPLDMSDPQVRARVEQERRAREITEAGGDVVVDPNTGEVTSSTGQSIEELLKLAQPDPVVETESFDIDTDDQDPVRPKSAADPAEPGPEDPAAAADRDEADNKTAAIVAQARTANAAAGIPPVISAKDEIDTAAQTGTGSAQDIKAEFLKLLPKYEEDPSIQGLNMAMMGFAIASGDSPNAAKNFAEGMKKTIPLFIKSKQKKDAFERETDLLASKYTIQRMEGDRTRGFAKNDYYVTKDFVGPDGQKYTTGQPLKLNDQAFALMEKQGLTGNLVSGTIYGKMLDNNAAIEKAKASAKPRSDYQKSSKTVDTMFGKLEIFYPVAEPSDPNAKAFPAGRENAWRKFTGDYVSSLEGLSFGQKGIQTAKDLLNTGDAVGFTSVVGRLGEAVKASKLVSPSFAKSIGIDLDKPSPANQYQNLNQILALQLAPALLKEGGKSIAIYERVMIARALGFSQAKESQSGGLILGSLDNAFTSEATARDSLERVESMLADSARKAHKEYTGYANLFGYQLSSSQDQGATSAPRGSFTYNVVDAPEGADFDIEIVAGGR